MQKKFVNVMLFLQKSYTYTVFCLDIQLRPSDGTEQTHGPFYSQEKLLLHCEQLVFLDYVRFVYA